MFKPTLALLVAAQVSSVALAKDFVLTKLPPSQSPIFDLTKGKAETYFDAVHDDNGIGPAMKESETDEDNVTVLKEGGGVRVKLADKIFNVHINFPKNEMGGRSYGWNDGKVGDWSDSMYLQFMGDVMDDQDKRELKKFYSVILNLLGSSDPTGIESLKPASQRVATNFLAIYTAETYRRMIKDTTQWDDALLQVTLLGSFHGGQTNFEMFYMGKFTGTTLDKGPGVYANGTPGTEAGKAGEKDADYDDYHQFSFDKNSKRSGINLTRNDFQLMGSAITAAEKDNDNLATIRNLIHRHSGNVYKDLAQFFALNEAKDLKPKDKKALTDAVVAFLLDVFDHADDISQDLRGKKKFKKKG